MNQTFLFLLSLMLLVGKQTIAQNIDEARWVDLEHKMMVHYQKGEYDKAIVYLIEAKEISINHDSLHANALNNLAYLYEKVGAYSEAEELYLECIALDKRVLGVNSKGYASSLNNLGLLYDLTGRYKEAESLYFKALDIRKKVLDSLHVHISGSYNNIAALYKLTGRNKKALKYYKLALEIYDKNPNPKIKAHYSPPILGNLANLLEDLGQIEEAKEIYYKTLKIMEDDIGKTHPDYTSTLGNLAHLYSRIKEYDKSIKLYEEAILLRQKKLGEKDPFYANVLQNLAHVYSLSGNHHKGLELVYQSIHINSHYRIDSSNISIIKEQATEPIFISNYIAIPSLIVLAKINKSLFKETQNIYYLLEAYKVLSATSTFILHEEKKLIKRADKLNLLRDNTKISALAIETAEELFKNTKQEEYIKNCIGFAERNKSAVLASTLANQNALAFGDVPQNLVLEEKRIQKSLRNLEQKLLQAKVNNDSVRIQKAQEQLVEANLEQDSLKKNLLRYYPKYSQLKYQTHDISIEKIQKNLLNEETTLLEYFIYKNTIKLLVIGNNTTKLISLDLEQNALEEQIKILRKSLSDYKFILENEHKVYQDFISSSSKLYQTLIAPAIDELKATKRLIIVPDAILGHIPFEVLLSSPTNSTENISYKDLNYLINDFQVSYSYSSSLLLENKKNSSRTNNGKLLAFAAAYPDARNMDLRNLTPSQEKYRRNLKPLSAVHEEVKFLQKQFPDHAFYFQNDANEANFKKNSKDYSILHFAMHGILNDKYPLLSSLVFTENGDSLEDNFLEAHEISQLQLNSDLVVLSACETGYGKFEQGEGVMSLARSFMYAGVPSLVVSLWQVNDHSTSIIMKTFYKSLNDGLSKDAALRHAKISYMKSATGLTAHPAFWSPFIQLGNAEPIQLKNKSPWMPFIVGGFVLLLIVIMLAFYYKLRKKNS